MKEVDQDVRAPHGRDPGLPARRRPPGRIPENKRSKHLFEKLLPRGAAAHQRRRHVRRRLLRRKPGRPDRRAGGPELHVHGPLGVSGYRTYLGTYVNLAKRLHFGINGFDTTSFFYSPNAYYYTGGFSRQGVLATQRYSGGNVHRPVSPRQVQAPRHDGGRHIPERAVRRSDGGSPAPGAVSTGGHSLLPEQRHLHAHRADPGPGDDALRELRAPVGKHLLHRRRDQRGGTPPANGRGGPPEVLAPRVDVDGLRGAGAGLLLLGRQTRRSSTSGATRSFAGIPTSRSRGTRASSPTSSCAFPSSTWRRRPSGSSGPFAAPSSRASAGPSTTGPASTSSRRPTTGGRTSTTPSSASRSPASTSSTAARPTASASSSSSWDTRSTSTGRS